MLVYLSFKTLIALIYTIGRYIVSGSSYDEMAIKLWYGQLPIVYAPKQVGMAIKWSTAGLVST